MLAYKDEFDIWHHWWIGGGVPDLPQVCTIQADGHELEMIRAAMNLAYVGRGGRVFMADPGAALD